MHNIWYFHNVINIDSGKIVKAKLKFMRVPSDWLADTLGAIEGCGDTIVRVS